jgi:hypothetical protein
VARAPLGSLPYPLVCIALGALLGWIPWLLHGPIPEKFNVHYLHGPTAVWAFYVSRLSIGLWVGLTRIPRPWWLRGGLCGALAMLPVGFIALAIPDCGFT